MYFHFLVSVCSFVAAFPYCLACRHMIRTPSQKNVFFHRLVENAHSVRSAATALPQAQHKAASAARTLYATIANPPMCVCHCLPVRAVCFAAVWLLAAPYFSFAYVRSNTHAEIYLPPIINRRAGRLKACQVERYFLRRLKGFKRSWGGAEKKQMCSHCVACRWLAVFGVCSPPQALHTPKNRQNANQREKYKRVTHRPTESSSFVYFTTLTLL